MILHVKISPNAKKNSIEGFLDNILKIKIHAEPDKGKANSELIQFLAKKLSIPKKNISIISGHTTRIKKLSIEGISSQSEVNKILDISIP